MGDPNKNKTTEQVNPNYFLHNTTKEGKQRSSHTYPNDAEAKTYLDWIYRIPEIESRLTALENKVRSYHG